MEQEYDKMLPTGFEPVISTSLLFAELQISSAGSRLLWDPKIELVLDQSTRLREHEKGLTDLSFK